MEKKKGFGSVKLNEIENMSKTELRKKAKEAGIEVGSVNRDELIALLRRRER